MSIKTIETRILDAKVNPLPIKQEINGKIYQSFNGADILINRIVGKTLTAKNIIGTSSVKGIKLYGANLLSCHVILEKNFSTDQTIENYGLLINLLAKLQQAKKSMVYGIVGGEGILTFYSNNEIVKIIKPNESFFVNDIDLSSVTAITISSGNYHDAYLGFGHSYDYVSYHEPKVVIELDDFVDLYGFNDKYEEYLEIVSKDDDNFKLVKHFNVVSIKLNELSNWTNEGNIFTADLPKAAKTDVGIPGLLSGFTYSRRPVAASVNKSFSLGANITIKNIPFDTIAEFLGVHGEDTLIYVTDYQDEVILDNIPKNQIIGLAESSNTIEVIDNSEVKCDIIILRQMEDQV